MRETFPLRPRWVVMGLAAVFFTVCAAVLVVMAGRGRGLVINGLIHLDPGEAKVFFFVLAGLSMGLVTLGIAGAWRQRGGRLVIEVDDDTITVPGSSFRPAAKIVRFADITRVFDQEINGQVFITLVHPGGKSWIHRQSVGDEAFTRLRRILEQRLAKR